MLFLGSKQSFGSAKHKATIVVLTLLALCLGAGALLMAVPGHLSAQADEVARKRAELEAELKEIEAAIEREEGNLQEKQRERSSLERDIAILDSQISKAQLSIRARNLSIQELTGDIGNKVDVIDALNDKLDREKRSLAQLLRKTNELDDFSTVELILGQKTLTDLFEELDSYDSVQAALHDSFDQIELTRGYTDAEKRALEDKRTQEEELRTLQELEKKTIENREAEKQDLLTVTRGEEKRYQSLIKEKQQTAAEIRARLFALRDSAAIPFGEAYEYAKSASAKTGVRPALILAILKQESELGENVGTCNRAGDPPDKKWDHIMPGPIHYANYVANGRSCSGGARSPCSWRDDQTIFKEITGKLGLDYQSMPLSCPISSVGGWGGAMGPSQFIPTTWRAYESQIGAIVGVTTPNPWNPEHAITGTALLMKDNGAANATYSAERMAALRYFAGGNATNPNYAFYGNQVMAHAAEFQKLIDVLVSS